MTRALPCPTIEAWARQVMRGIERPIGPSGFDRSNPLGDIAHDLPADPNAAEWEIERRKKAILANPAHEANRSGRFGPDLGGYLETFLMIGRISHQRPYPWLLRRALLHAYWLKAPFEEMVLAPEFRTFNADDPGWIESWRSLGMESPLMANSASFVLSKPEWVPHLAVASAVREFRVLVCSARGRNADESVP